MNDMRRQTLRMADGGSFITRWANNVMKPAQSRLRQMDAPAPTPTAPVVAPPPQTAAPVTVENPAGIRFADGGGLRGDPYRKGSMDGGRVVGEGGPVDDKVPAKYSPGEYVLPADTALAIGHENLDAIKDATHTPAAVQRRYSLRGNPHGEQDGQGQNGLGERQVGIPRRAEGRVGVANVAGLDAQDRGAVRDRVHPLEQVGRSQTLRLADGGGYRPNFSIPDPIQQYPTRPQLGMSPPGTAIGPATYRPNFTMPAGDGVVGNGPAGGRFNTAGAADVSAKNFGEAAHGERVNPTPKPDGRYGAPPNPAVNEVPAKAPTAPRPTLRAGMAAQPTALSKSAFAAGRAVDGVAKLASGPLGRLAGGADVVSHFNDYKVNDPDVDSSAGGTWSALRNGDFGGAGRSLSKGALETGMDLGNFAANTLDYVVPGKAPVSTAYNKRLRDQFGDQLAPHASVTAQANAASPTQVPKPPTLRDGASPSPNPTDQRLTAGTQATPAPGQDPGRVTLRGMAGTNVDGAPGVSKFVQNGKTLYSNVPGADNDKLMSNNPGVSTVPGMSQAQIDRTLTNPDGSRWSEGDNATMAANLRDGQDAYRGTSRGQAKPQFINAFKAQTDRRGQDLQHSATLRGQDVQLTGQQMTAATARNAARIDQMNKDRGYSLDVQKFGEEKAKTLFTQREQADKDLTSSLEAMFTTRDDKGNSVVDRDRVATHKAGVLSYIGNTITQLQAVPQDSPDYAQAQQTAAELQSKNASALSPDRLQKLIAQLEVKDRSAGASGMSPFSGSHVDSTDPSAYDVVGKDEGLLQDQYRLRNGSRIPTRALDYDKGGNPILPNTFGNRPTTRFDIVKKDLRNGY